MKCDLWKFTVVRNSSGRLFDVISSATQNEWSFRTKQTCHAHVKIEQYYYYICIHTHYVFVGLTL